ncbi:MAG: DNA-binding protein [Tardiphaga sp.]|uniref:H-NS histone family protein n=1 Tax=Tardiphaga sp. TaxID=1926292 RepID=UPI00260408EE|nr:H-NS histone family protein [Tardiphaga sp.]MDB5503499.1 DNA-binding protein [Tardiphaga sp.]
MPIPQIKSLSVTELLALREAVDRQLQERRAELQAQLAQIGSNGKASTAKGTTVPPKYRHPKTGETWTGRGGVAGWLAKELAAGKKRDDFLIVKAAKKPRGKTK